MPFFTSRSFVRNISPPSDRKTDNIHWRAYSHLFLQITPWVVGHNDAITDKCPPHQSPRTFQLYSTPVIELFILWIYFSNVKFLIVQSSELLRPFIALSETSDMPLFVGNVRYCQWLYIKPKIQSQSGNDDKTNIFVGKFFQTVRVITSTQVFTFNAW